MSDADNFDLPKVDKAEDATIPDDYREFHKLVLRSRKVIGKRIKQRKKLKEKHDDVG